MNLTVQKKKDFENSTTNASLIIVNSGTVGLDLQVQKQAKP